MREYPNRMTAAEGIAAAMASVEAKAEPVLRDRLAEGVSGEAIRDFAFGQESSGYLRDKVIAMCGRVIGAREHAQYGALVAGAVPYVVDDGLAASLERTVEADPNGIERNLDLVDVPDEGIWVEWDEGARSSGSLADGSERPFQVPGTVAAVRVGALVVRDPDDADRIVVMSSWSLPDGSPRTSYAAVAASRHDLAYNAWMARDRFSRVPRESSYRMLLHVQAYVPPGLAEEIEFLAGLGSGGDLGEDVKRGARRDATSDVIFVLAAVLALRAGGVVKELAGGVTRCALGSRRSDRFAALRERLLGSGFRRRGINEAARVEFYAPAAPQRGAGA